MSFSPLSQKALALTVTLFITATFNQSSFAQNTPQQAQTPPAQKITVEGIYTGKYRDITALPVKTWLSDGSLVLFDVRKPAAERGYEIVNPQTGKRSPLFDMAKARTSMKALRSTENIPALTFNAIGTFAYIDLGEDIVLLDVKTAEFRAVAKGVKEETTRFSPDGMKLAYVKNNDLYLYDIAKQAGMRLTSDGSATILNGTHSWVYWEEVFDRDDRGFFWSPDSKAIAYYQSDESMVSQVTFPDVKPAVPDNIVQRYPKAGTTNPKVKLGIIELDKPTQTTWLDVTAGVNASIEYLARVQWLPSGKQLAVQTMPRNQYEVTVHLADRATGKMTALLTEKDSGWVNLNDDLHFFKDGKR